MAEEQPYEEALQQWRRSMEDSLRAEDGWLALAGLFWLNEGSNRIGADLACDVVLPAGSAPDDVGSFTLHGGRVTLDVIDGSAVTVNGVPTMTAMLMSDANGAPDIVAIGSL